MIKGIITLIIIVLTATALYWKIKTPDLVTVQTLFAERGNIKNVIDLTGKVINDKTVTLSALVDGQITAMKIIKGQQVQQGQELASFDRREADSEIVRLQAELELENEKVVLSKSTFNRLLNMQSAGNVSQQQIDDARTEWRISKARYKVSQASLEMARIQQEKFSVIAPFSGVITEKTTEVGQWVEAGTSLFTLVALQGREIEVNIDTSDRGLIEINQQANLKSDAWPNHNWTENIHWLAPAVSEKDNEALNSFTARLSLGNQAPALILGQQVDVELVLQQKEDIIKIPYSVLIEENGRKQIAIVDDAGFIQIREIKTGIEDIRYIEVESGIDVDQKIAIVQDQPFRQGQQVIAE